MAQEFTFAPRVPQPQQQPVQQPQMQQPMYQQPQPMYQQQPVYQQPQPVYQQPYPNMAPQMGYAYPQTNIAQPNDGSREFMEAYNKNKAAYDELNRKVKAGPTKEDATSNYEKMEAMVEKIQTDVEGKNIESAKKAETLNELVDLLTTVINAIDKPEVWLPKERMKYAEPLKSSKLGISLVKHLSSYRDTVKRLG